MLRSSSLDFFGLQLLAPAIRACLASADNQVTRFADVSEHALLAAVDASVAFQKQQLLQLHRQVNKAVRAKAKLQEELDKDPGKFSIRKMATGSIDDFHKGLQDRIGKRHAYIFCILFPCINCIFPLLRLAQS